MSQLPDDTKPKSPFHDPQTTPPRTPTVSITDTEDDDPIAGPGCFLYSVVGAVVLLIALAIVLLAAAAGWTAGQRIASQSIESTQRAEIQKQLDLIALDIEQGNIGFLGNRIDYLATLGVPEVADLMLTGTAYYNSQLPTATSTPTNTMAFTPTPQFTQTAEILPTIDPQADITAQLAQRLDKAREYVSLAQWENAIDELDIIISTQPNYESAAVRNLMSRALNAFARSLFGQGELAEAVIYTDRAEEFGPLDEGLSVEREVANNFLSAKALIGTSEYARTINFLQAANRLASPDYMGGEIRTLLNQEYTAFGDALLNFAPCDAVTQYNNALSISVSGTVAGKRDLARDYCEFGTPTPEGFVPSPTPEGGEASPPG